MRQIGLTDNGAADERGVIGAHRASVHFSIVVPTYNEESDIAGTLDALTSLDYPDKEIVVVDDSTDATAGIVTAYAQKGVRLIRPATRKGRCEARNIGILSSTGDVVVVLNADVRPRKDFLRQLVRHYQQGYDYVLVRSAVSNTEASFARYIQAQTAADYMGDPSWMEWTEGFSCRKKVAVEAGMFPAGFVVPLCAGEDGYFGTRLRAIGARKKIDLSITVDHVAPATLREYWQVRKGRGKGSPQVRRFLHRWPVIGIAAWAILRVVRTFTLVLSVVPGLLIAWSATRHSQCGSRDLIPFWVAWMIEQVAFVVGEWQGILELVRAEHTVRHAAAR